jgi:hypothetical protein
MAWGNPGYPQSGSVTFVPLPSGDLEAFGPDGHSLGTLTPIPPGGGNGKVAIVADDVTEQDFLDAKLKVGATLAKSTGTSGGSEYLQLDSNAALSDVLGVGADAGGTTITGLGAPVNPHDAARLTDIPTSAPGGLLGALVYKSGSDTAIKTAVSGYTSVDIDATHVALAIAVPASGRILVMLQACVVNFTADGVASLAVRAGSTELARQWLPMLGTPAGFPASIGHTGGIMPCWFYITGLTPGALTIKGGISGDAGSATFNVYANDGPSNTSDHHASPLVMAAWGA